MKEDAFSSSSEHLVSIADDKQLSLKTTNAPDSNDKQQVEQLVRSPNQSNCEKIFQDQKEKIRIHNKKNIINHTKHFSNSELIFNAKSL